MQVVQVLIPQVKLPILDYIVQQGMVVGRGDCVLVPLRRAQRAGIVVGISPGGVDCGVLREIISVVDFKISDDMLHFILKASKYYVTEPGSMAKLMLPFEDIILNRSGISDS